MSLEEANNENLSVLLNELGDRLQIANRSLLEPEDYDLDKYSELKFLHQVIKQKGNISAMESQAFIDELASLRKK